MASKPLVVIPVFFHKPAHLDLLTKCLVSLRDKKRTSTPVDIILVDDCSPLQGKSQVLKHFADTYDCEVHEKRENTGFSKTVNIGLRQAERESRVAVLCNMDVEFSCEGFEHPKWLDIALKDDGDLVGGKLLYSSGMVQHAGVYYSLLHRYLDHIGRYAPPNMKDINVRRELPVTGALQIIKPQVFEAVGVYDENFKMAYEDIDYCLRVMLPKEHGGAGMKVVYNPEVVAIHHESMIRGGEKKYSDWHNEAWVLFQQKYSRTPLQQFIPPIDRERT